MQLQGRQAPGSDDNGAELPFSFYTLNPVLRGYYSVTSNGGELGAEVLGM